MIGLLDLPDELLLLLVQHMRDIEDFTNAACTCRRLRRVLNDTTPNVILRLAARSAPTFFHPHPWFLVLATARQVADWVIGNAERTRELMVAFRDGVEGLLELALRVAGLTLSDIRRLHLDRYDIINPLCNLIDTMIGKQWYATPRFWNGGVSNANTLYAEIEPVTFQMLVYGELFGSTMRSFLEPERVLPRFGVDVRVEYLKYLAPAWINKKGGFEGYEVLQTGPYAPDRAEELSEDYQEAIRFLIRSSGRWNRAWRRVVHRVAPDFEGEENDWRQKLYWTAITQVGGLDGMELVAQGLDEDAEVPAAWRERILEIRDRVAALDAKHAPRSVMFGKRDLEVSKAPDLAAETRAYTKGRYE